MLSTLVTMARDGIAGSPELLAYLHEWGARTDEVLDRVRAETGEMPNAAMQISPDQGALLTLLARLTGASNALEVGTFTGYSAICIARGLPDAGRLTCLEVDPDFAAIAQRNIEAAGVGDKVEIRIGPAKESLEAMPAEPTFDLAFVDADKQAYPAYYELVLERVRQGGLILLDNMLQGGRVLTRETENAAVVDDLSRAIKADERVDMAMTVSADGLTLVRKR
jgi:caffeoyl-CoA O-methyltransferase